MPDQEVKKSESRFFYSNNYAERSRHVCELCGEETETLRYHVASQHAHEVDEVNTQFSLDRDFDVKSFHKCAICNTQLIFTNHNLKNHVRFAHSMSIQTYNEAYMTGAANTFGNTSSDSIEQGYELELEKGENNPPEQISSSYQDFVKVVCGVCQKPVELDIFYRNHISSRHNLTTTQYRAKYGRAPLLQNTFHQCAICSKTFLFTRENLYGHVTIFHKLQLRIYARQYISDHVQSVLEEEMMDMSCRFSNSYQDESRVQCFACEAILPHSQLKDHLEHHKTSLEIHLADKQNGGLLFIEKVYHECGECSALLLLARDTVQQHVATVHYLTPLQYRIRHLQDVPDPNLQKKEDEDPETKQWCDGTTYRCPMCRKYFYRSFTFRIHLMRRHSILDPDNINERKSTLMQDAKVQQYSYTCCICQQHLRRDRADIQSHLQAAHSTTFQMYTDIYESGKLKVQGDVRQTISRLLTGGGLVLSAIYRQEHTLEVLKMDDDTALETTPTLALPYYPDVQSPTIDSSSHPNSNNSHQSTAVLVTDNPDVLSPTGKMDSAKKSTRRRSYGVLVSRPTVVKNAVFTDISNAATNGIGFSAGAKPRSNSGQKKAAASKVVSPKPKRKPTLPAVTYSRSSQRSVSVVTLSTFDEDVPKAADSATPDTISFKTKNNLLVSTSKASTSITMRNDEDLSGSLQVVSSVAVKSYNRHVLVAPPPAKVLSTSTAAPTSSGAFLATGVGHCGRGDGLSRELVCAKPDRALTKGNAEKIFGNSKITRQKSLGDIKGLVNKQVKSSGLNGTTSIVLPLEYHPSTVEKEEARGVHMRPQRKRKLPARLSDGNFLKEISASPAGGRSNRQNEFLRPGKVFPVHTGSLLPSAGPTPSAGPLAEIGDLGEITPEVSRKKARRSKSLIPKKHLSLISKKHLLSRIAVGSPLEVANSDDGSNLVPKNRDCQGQTPVQHVASSSQKKKKKQSTQEAGAVKGGKAKSMVRLRYGSPAKWMIEDRPHQPSPESTRLPATQGESAGSPLQLFQAAVYGCPVEGCSWSCSEDGMRGGPALLHLLRVHGVQPAMARQRGLMFQLRHSSV